MIKKYVINRLLDEDLDMQERMFLLLSSIGLLGLIIMMIVRFVHDSDKTEFFVLLTFGLLFATVTHFSISRNRIQTGGVILGMLISFVMFPAVFFVGGGLSGGAPIWFIFAAIYCALVLRGNTRFVMLLLSLLSAVAVYAIGYNYPDVVHHYSEKGAYFDSITSLIVVSVLLVILILFQNYIYRIENERASEQKKELEELSASRNRFFSSMSHEIRTPINTIIGLNEMILREDISEEVAEDAKNIQGASKMLLTIINDILDMSKIESGQMTVVNVPYNMGDMLSDIVNMIWIRAKEKGLDFHVDVDSSLPAELYGDEVRIKQVLVNILSNAVKYTSKGSVTLSIQGRRVGGNRAVISYSVEDTGAGIKKENIPYLFDAFKRVDEEKNRYIEGTGLGLSIVKQIVELMGGEITVNSIYTRGSTFIVTLEQEIVGEEELGELDFEARHAMNTFEHYKQSFEAPTVNLLVVDDTASNIMVVKKLLRDTRIHIETASDGEEAVKKCLNSRYDCILMDHLMPNMDGVEALHHIREQVGGMNAMTPVVVLTANVGSDNQEKYIKEGFDGYLLKPVDGATLEGALLRVLPKDKVSITGEVENGVELQMPVSTRRKRRSVMISADSVCDIPFETAKKKHIAILPVHIRTEEGIFLDGVETETDGVLDYLYDKKKQVFSEAATVGEYEEFFAEHLTEAQYIVHISVAKETSRAYDRAMEAASTFDNVLVVDSGHISSGMGLIVMRAADLAARDVPAYEIVGMIKEMRKRVSTSFIMAGTEYLAHSGRMRNRDHAVSDALMMRPVIRLKGSDMVMSRVYYGSTKRVRHRYIISELFDPATIDKSIVFICYAGVSREELLDIQRQIMSRVTFEEVVLQKATPAVSINCGPGTIGIMYMRI